jgi:hypothetical protein
VTKIHYSRIQNKDQKKDPSSFLRRRLQAHKKTMGVLIFFEKSPYIFRNFKLSNLILHLEFGTKIEGDN